MKITSITFVGYPVTDVARARKFYTEVLGLQETMAHEISPGQFWIEYEIGSEHCLAISNAWPTGGDANCPTAALEVEDIEQAHAELEAAGALSREHREIMASPVCRFCFAQDPDGNPFMIHQHTPAAS